MQNKRLAQKFLIRIMVALLVGQAVSVSCSVYFNWRSQVQDLDDKVRILGKQLASIAGTSRASFDFTYLGQLVDQVVDNVDVVHVRYVDTTGYAVINKQAVYRTRTLIRTMNIPVLDGAADAGRMEIKYSQDRIKANIIRDMAITATVQLVSFLVLVLLVIILFRRYISSRIALLNDNIQRITDGDLTCRTSERWDDELGVIADGFNLLVDWLAKTIVKIRSISANVSDASDHLNRTFKDLINGINRQQLSTENALTSVQNTADSLQTVSSATENLLELSGESSAALEQIIQSSQGFVGKIERLNNLVNSSYDTILAMSVSSREVAAVAGSATNSMEYASEAVSSINLSVTRIGSIVNETTELANNTNSVIADQGIVSVQDAIESMKRIDRLVISLSATVSNLGARSKDIAKVLDVIKEVTEQTKLLSLNAQILSGQAGEYGKPFAVVAAEMKSLSDKTAHSTKEIESIVSTIQQEIKTAVSSASDTSNMVTEGKTVAARANQALLSIQNASNRSTEAIRSIEEMAAQQKTDLGQIVHTFDEIRNLIHEVNRATSEEDDIMGHLLEGFTSIREAMEISRTSSQEQATSIQMISENMALANEKTRVIADAARDQRETSDEMVRAMKRVIQIGAETVNGVRDVSSRIVVIGHEVEALNREIKSFKTETDLPSPAKTPPADSK